MIFRRALQFLSVVLAGAMEWGYWHASTHAYLDIQFHDHGLATNNLAYDTPHNATLELFDARGSLLAVANSVEPYGYLSTKHPTLGDCSSLQGAGGDAYSACYSDLSRWSSGWASWWVPLPHVGGTPFEYIQLQVDVDSRSCSIVPA